LLAAPVKAGLEDLVAEVVPTAVLVVAATVTTAGVVEVVQTLVVFWYTGAGETTLEVVTGLTMVQGQLVMVKVVLLRTV